MDRVLHTLIQLAVASLAAALVLLASPPRALPQSPDSAHQTWNRGVRTSPCEVVRVDSERVSKLLGRWRTPPPAPSRPGLWRVLLPRRVALTRRDQDYDGVGWYAGSTGTESERGLFGNTRGYSVTVQWDLAPLWSARPARPDPLARAERMERVASRLALAHERLLRASSEAGRLSRSDPRCPRLRARARSALLVLRAVLGPVGPTARITSRSRPPPAAPPSPPRAGPARPDPDRPR